ncbi:MAG: pilin [candidate division WOR-3 bacterium]
MLKIGCKGGGCVDCCFGSNYECGSIGLFQIYTCCQKINNRPPTDRCGIKNISQGGATISYLEKDCQMGKACPPSGTGQCQNCDGTYTGICYKNGDGPLFNACCSGFTCPKEVNGVTPCISAELLTQKLIKRLASIIYPVTLIIGMWLVVINGYRMMTSQGDPNKLQNAKEGLTSAIIGILFIMLAVSILRVIIMSMITGDVDPFG